MEPNETITSIFTRFTDIINCLKSLGRMYTNSDVVRKILHSLHRTWEAKVTVIQEAKDLNTLSLEELLGSLMTHELMVQQKSEEEGKMKRIIALKAISENEEEESGSEEGESDNEVALLTRKFKRFLRRRGPPSKGKSLFKRNQPKGKEKEEKKEARPDKAGKNRSKDGTEGKKEREKRKKKERKREE